MREQPSAPWDTGNSGMSLVSNANFYIHSLFLHSERDVSSHWHPCRTEREHAKERSNFSYFSLSVTLLMTSIHEGFFSKSTSLFGVWTALKKSRRTSRSLLPEAYFFPWRDSWRYLRCCAVLKQAMTIIEHRVVVFFLLWLNHQVMKSWLIQNRTGAIRAVRRKILLKPAFWFCSVANKTEQLDINRTFLLLPILQPNDIAIHLGHRRFMVRFPFCWNQTSNWALGVPLSTSLSPDHHTQQLFCSPWNMSNGLNTKDSDSIVRYPMFLVKVSLSCSGSQKRLESGFANYPLPSTVHYRREKYLHQR